MSFDDQGGGLLPPESWSNGGREYTPGTLGVRAKLGTLARR